MEFMYRVLIDRYHYDPNDIFVFHFDGTLNVSPTFGVLPIQGLPIWPGDNSAFRLQINGAATQANLENCLAGLATGLQPPDSLFLFMTGHGTDFGTNGQQVWIRCFPRSDFYPADSLALRLAALPAIRQLMVALEPCNSGGFVSPILLASTAQETTVAAACPADGTSRGGSTADPYSPFSRAWISVMNGFGPDGVTVVPAPGPVVTALDAFTYSVVQDFYDRPQYGNQTPTSDGMTLG